MRLARWRSTPWFCDGIRAEYTDEDIALMEPLDGVVYGTAMGKTSRGPYRATIEAGGRSMPGTGQTAAEALRNAQRYLLEETAA